MAIDLKKHIHILSFDIPFPADYGGVIDVFYKVKALAQMGYQVHLHCFVYGRKKAKELDEICYSVHYYPRKKGISHLLTSLPYIVSTRSCKKLFNELQKDRYPILYEGLHTTAILYFKEMKGRENYIRMHNIEHDYYFYLSQSTSNIFKKWYYQTESSKLKKYEKVLDKADQVFAISKADTQELQKRYPHVHHISAFHSNNQIKSKQGRGTYIVYHGNLGVEENEKAALFLLRNVFPKLKYACIIAGKNPSKRLLQIADQWNNIEIIANPDQKRMTSLISDAQINILPTFQPTGIKLKLIDSIALGRFCMVNTPMIQDTGLENLTICRNSAEEMILEIHSLMNQDFLEIDVLKRKELWEKSFSNQALIRKIQKYI
jgi:hypothetical protein